MRTKKTEGEQHRMAGGRDASKAGGFRFTPMERTSSSPRKIASAFLRALWQRNQKLKWYTQFVWFALSSRAFDFAPEIMSSICMLSFSKIYTDAHK